MIAKFSSEPTARPPETTILAEASSGRSDACTLSSTEAETAGSADRVNGLDRARSLLAGGGEARAADGDDLLRVRRLHRLDRVAGIDRPLERIASTTSVISEITITSSFAASRGATFLPVVVPGNRIWS